MVNVDKLLSKIYKYNDQKKIDAAIDIVIMFFWNASAEQNYEIMNEFYKKIDVSKITNGSILCAPIMNTFKYIPKIPEHIPYCMKIMDRYKEIGYTDEAIHDIVDRYLTVGNYWRDMSLLNAPEWLSGKKPE